MVETDLYFGLDKPGGGRLSEEEWAGFTAKYVSAVFRDGSTTVTALGSWRDPVSGKLITEPSRLLICIHPNTNQFSKRIDSLRNAYKKLFDQQSVLRVDKKVAVSF
jgi:hypothetical protein